MPTLETSLPTAAETVLAEAAQRVADLSPQTDLTQTLGWADSALAAWDEISGPAPMKARARLEVLILRAHVLRELGTPATLRAAVTAYDEALAAFDQANLPPGPATINQNASLWMKRGIALLALGDPGSLSEAVPSFERAIDLRSRLTLEGNPWYRWVLMAGWMNRADALTRLGGEERIREALRNYDLAIAHLQTLPLNQEPRFRWRLGVAWLNRGLTWQALHPLQGRDQALRSFDNCIALFRQAPELPRADDRRTLAAAWFNRANLLVQGDAPRGPKAREAALAAVQISRAGEENDLQFAEVGIKSRHVLCAALAGMLEAPGVNEKEAEGWILEATDAVEESLRLSRLWEARGHVIFRPFLEEMFHFGARIYRAFQPHFLAEFLMEGKASVFTEAMRQAAREALGQAALQIRGEGLSRLNPQTLQRLLETLASLTEAGRQLAQPVTA